MSELEYYRLCLKTEGIKVLLSNKLGCDDLVGQTYEIIDELMNIIGDNSGTERAKQLDLCNMAYEDLGMFVDIEEGE